jgi:hypothetical protein|nr:MAG TPA: hypothetical protein [Caudoviricetes sp.]
MRTLIFVLIIIGCFAIGYLSRGSLGVLSLLLSYLSFLLGVVICASFSSEEALNRELLELKKKYYTLKYVKDKAE